jgi:hypothetical protein
VYPTLGESGFPLGESGFPLGEIGSFRGDKMGETELGWGDDASGITGRLGI